MPTLFTKYTELKNWLFLIVVGVVLMVSSCDKEEAEPTYTQADRARCAHIDQEAELGGYLYNLCLVNPWPTELPEVEVGGEPVLATWINDKLAFVAYDPRESLRFNIQLDDYPDDGYINLIGHRATFDDIDSSYFYFKLSFNRDGEIIQRSESQFTVRRHSVKGRYHIIKSESRIEFQEENGYGYGTFSLTLTDSTTNETITLTDGRFHAPFGG